MNAKEEKLLRLALDRGAIVGETDNVAIMFIRKLRERNANMDELFVKYQSNSNRYNGSNAHIMPFG